METHILSDMLNYVELSEIGIYLTIYCMVIDAVASFIHNIGFFKRSQDTVQKSVECKLLFVKQIYIPVMMIQKLNCLE